MTTNQTGDGALCKSAEESPILSVVSKEIIMIIVKKPPLGVTPEKTWKEKRLVELINAIVRYNEAGLQDEGCVFIWKDEADRLSKELGYGENRYE